MSTTGSIIEPRNKSLLQAAIGGLAQSRHAPAHEAIGTQIMQLALDFEASPSIMDVRNAESPMDAPALLEMQIPNVPPVEADAARVTEESPGFVIGNGAYIDLAIELMLTCAEDLVMVQKVLSRGDDLPTRTRNRANKIKDDTIAWLRNTPPDDEHYFRFSFHDCAEMLEEELKLQSLGQVAIPRIADRADELAQWIINDPEAAKHYLSRYKRIFGQDDGHIMTDDDELNDDTSHTIRQRHGA